VNILVDTSVWSLVLRRGVPANSAFERELAELIREGRISRESEERSSSESCATGSEHSATLCLMRATTKRRLHVSTDAARKACRAGASISCCVPCVYVGTWLSSRRTRTSSIILRSLASSCMRCVRS
jgi:hypothetical protein